MIQNKYINQKELDADKDNKLNDKILLSNEGYGMIEMLDFIIKLLNRRKE